MAEERRTASDEGLADEVAMKATGALLRTKVLCLGMLLSEEGLDKLYSAYEENSAEVETTGFGEQIQKTFQGERGRRGAGAAMERALPRRGSGSCSGSR